MCDTGYLTHKIRFGSGRRGIWLETKRRELDPVLAAVPLETSSRNQDCSQDGYSIHLELYAARVCLFRGPVVAIACAEADGRICLYVLEFCVLGLQFLQCMVVGVCTMVSC